MVKVVIQNFLLSLNPPRYQENIGEMWFNGMSIHQNTAKAKRVRKLKKSPSKCHANLTPQQ
jgi:hypothetical protein